MRHLVEKVTANLTGAKIKGFVDLDAGDVGPLLVAFFDQRPRCVSCPAALSLWLI